MFCPRLCTAALLLAPVFLQAAESTDIPEHYRDAANKLVQAALADDAGYDRLAYLCDRIGNRLSGSTTLPRAIAWGAQQMREAGFSNVATPPVSVPHWVRGKESATLTAPIERSLHMLGLGMSVGTSPHGIEADVVVVSNFDELKTAGERVRGKIVLFNAPYEGYGRTVAYRTAGPSRAAALGAVAVLVRSITPLAMQIPHTGTLNYVPGAPKIPAAAVSVEDALLLARLAKAGDTVRVHLDMEAHMEPDVQSANVIGELPGTEHPEQVVVMGGHIDSWDVGQGAQDDGSGIMATMEAAVLIHKLGLKPRRTIRVVFWVNEENGEHGGRAYRDWVGPAVKNHVAAIEMDSGAERPVGFGYGIPTYARRPVPGAVPGAARTPSPEEERSLELCRKIGKLLEPIGADVVTAGGGGSDIEAITALGVPSLSPRTSGEHYFDWHHTVTDTLDKVNKDDFRKNIAVLSVLAYVLADTPDRLAGSTMPADE